MMHKYLQITEDLSISQLAYKLLFFPCPQWIETCYGSSSDIPNKFSFSEHVMFIIPIVFRLKS